MGRVYLVGGDDKNLSRQEYRRINHPIVDKTLESKRPLKLFICYIMPVGYAHADRDPVRGLYSRLTWDGVDAWLDKGR
jgi:hypothetical protein